MYESHPYVATPNDNEVVWRYMDFTKFVSLLSKQALFFCRADKLEDQFEGRYTSANNEQRILWLEADNLRAVKKLGYAQKSRKEIEQTADNMEKMYEQLRSMSLINCWIRNDYESAAMWKIFGNVYNGIAIQTSCINLKEAFNKTEEGIYIGKVNYVDMENDLIQEGNTIPVFFHKWKYYSYENEIRLFTEVKPEKGFEYDWSKEEVEAGKYLHVDLDKLIERIYVAPQSQNWFFQLVKSVLERYGLEKEIQKSRLGESPQKLIG